MDPAAVPTSGDTCRVCGTGGHFEHYELREMLFGSHAAFDYMRCPSCGAMQIVDVPADLAAYYPTDYWPEGVSTDIGTPSRFALGSKLRQSFIFSRLPAGRLLDHLGGSAEPFGPWRSFAGRTGLRTFDDPILDVGCGQAPRHLLAMKRAGFRNLRGVDPYIDAASTRFGFRIDRSSIHETDGAYQLVMLNHSFEHAPDPSQVMISIRRLLMPGGVALVRTPVMGSWFWQEYGADWIELDPPRHLFVHTEASLSRCAAAAGLRINLVIWESRSWEIVASEQIKAAVAWRDPESWAVNPPGAFDDSQLEAFRIRADELNREGRAGRAAFFLEASRA